MSDTFTKISDTEVSVERVRTETVDVGNLKRKLAALNRQRDFLNAQIAQIATDIEGAKLIGVDPIFTTELPPA